MRVAPIATQLEEPLGLAQSLCAALEACFGSRFQTVREEEVQQLRFDRKLFPVALSQQELEWLAEEIQAATASLCLSFDAGHEFLVVPIPSEDFADDRCFLLGRIDAKSASLAPALADAKLLNLQ